MVLFVTSSPYVNDADRAILSNDNDFIDRIRGVLPPAPGRCSLPLIPITGKIPAALPRTPQALSPRRGCPFSPTTFSTASTRKMQKL